MSAGSGPPLRSPMITRQGYAMPPWAMFFQSLSRPGLVFGSHSERINSYGAEWQQPGTYFFELDRGTLYMLMDLTSPLLTAVDLDSPSGAAVLYVSDTQGFRIGQIVYIGQGTAREEIGSIASIAPGVSFTMEQNLASTHTAAQADRVTGSPKTAVDANSPSGATTLNVTSTMGFEVGDRIIIGSNTARQEYAVVASVTAGVSLTLETNLIFTHPAPTPTVPGDRVGLAPQWVYLLGTYEDTLANIATDLGKLDAGFLFRSSDYARTWRWTGTAWERAPGELPTLFVGLFCTAPGTGWKTLDGTGNPFTYTTDLAGTSTITIQSTHGYYPKMAAAFTGNQVGWTLSAAAGGASMGEPQHMDFLPYVKL